MAEPQFPPDQIAGMGLPAEAMEVMWMFFDVRPKTLPKNMFVIDFVSTRLIL